MTYNMHFLHCRVAIRNSKQQGEKVRQEVSELVNRGETQSLQNVRMNS